MIYKIVCLNPTWSELNESRLVVGSSQNIIGGFVNTSEAKDNLFLSPPDKPLYYSFRNLWN